MFELNEITGGKVFYPGGCPVEAVGALFVVVVSEDVVIVSAAAGFGIGIVYVAACTHTIFSSVFSFFLFIGTVTIFS